MEDDRLEILYRESLRGLRQMLSQAFLQGSACQDSLNLSDGIIIILVDEGRMIDDLGLSSAVRHKHDAPTLHHFRHRDAF